MVVVGLLRWVAVEVEVAGLFRWAAVEVVVGRRLRRRTTTAAVGAVADRRVGPAVPCSLLWLPRRLCSLVAVAVAVAAVRQGELERSRTNPPLLPLPMMAATAVVVVATLLVPVAVRRHRCYYHRHHLVWSSPAGSTRRCVAAPNADALPCAARRSTGFPCAENSAANRSSAPLPRQQQSPACTMARRCRRCRTGGPPCRLHGCPSSRLPDEHHRYSCYSRCSGFGSPPLRCRGAERRRWQGHVHSVGSCCWGCCCCC